MKILSLDRATRSLSNGYPTWPSHATRDISVIPSPSFPTRRTQCYGQLRSESKGNQLASEESTCLGPKPVRRAHDEFTATPSGISKWKHLWATVEGVIIQICVSENGVKVFNLVTTEGMKAIRPAYAAKLTNVETSGPWIHGDTRDEIVTNTTPTATLHPHWSSAGDVTGNTLLNGIVI